MLMVVLIAVNALIKIYRLKGIVSLERKSILGVIRLRLEKNVKSINEKTTVTKSHRRLI